ncbi:MAG TPA: hypothetical protein VKB16_09545 [Beijerinckiaceae bacterium]|nr:hypothetical protein [Beijerinckiaceae bacterium]
MVIGQDEAYPNDLADDLRPNWTLVVLGTLALAAVSVGALAWPLAVISIALGALMIAGADVDARTCILPDTITFSALACGVLAAVVLEPLSPWPANSARSPAPRRRRARLARCASATPD